VLSTRFLALIVRGVARLVGIEGGVVSGVINLESSDVEASDRRPRHDEHYHEG
jgi:transposase